MKKPAAFPSPGVVFTEPGTKEQRQQGAYEGMELRDYFAAKALQSFMVWALDQPHFKYYDTAAKAAAGYAKSSYLIADAMLAAREASK